MSTGLLIAFEGIDGTGKSTQLPLLAEYLRGLGYSVLETKEPTNGHYGQRIRELYSNRQQVTREEELELFLLDRQTHVADCILPALDQGMVVLTDRYYFSTAAYQGATGCDPAIIFAQNAFAPVPDVALFLLVPTATGLARIQDIRGDRLNDFEQYEQLEQVAALFASFTQPCIQRIDAARGLMEVHASICAAVDTLLAQERMKDAS